MGDNMNGFRSSFSNRSNVPMPTVMDVDPSGDYTHFNPSSTNGNESHDTRDIVVPPLGQSVTQGSSREHAGYVTPTGNESASDSKKFWSSWVRTKSKPMEPRLPEAVQVPIASCNQNDDAYYMKHPKRGKCLIFNHVTFFPNLFLTNRTGSEVDANKIQTTFSKLGFSAVVYEDQTFQQIFDITSNVSKEDLSQHDCIVIFILTHGEANELYAKDMTYKPNSIFNLFTAQKCPTLAGKPKMFFIQACRGDQYDDGTVLHAACRTQVDGSAGVGEQSYRIPNQADFLVVYSTFEAMKENFDMLTLTIQYLSLGHFSWRNNKTGGCFIQSLCDVFEQYFVQKDVLSMMTLVNRRVAAYESRSKDPTLDKKKQVPHVCHTLTREIYFTRSSDLQGTLV